ncbi:glycosyltransferase family 2 protein [Imhoffiella purpurea]|uniref:Glycosyl transferase n=1 Tax=Imhoffiella purpurea TaxID=1249627 RepID=W9VGS9_9GAMM|nr:glycosyltransferase family 2 protein [Imhoffiella purpurea]EXJ16226.1 Glycosyl transferase [Imhoffiella purpurea]
MNRLWVVIPAYNEAVSIRDICLRVLEQPIERLVVVDDGSADGTAAAIADLPLTCLTNPVNRGKGASLLRGMRHALAAGATHIVSLDADGQHRPEDIPRLAARIQQHPDRILIAARLLNREQAPPLRRFANAFADFWISWACGQAIRDTQSGFRIYPSRLFERIDTRPKPDAGFAFESEILIDAAWQGHFTLAIPIETLYHPHARPSHYRAYEDTASIVRMVAAKLAQRHFYPLGLWRSLMRRPPPEQGNADLQPLDEGREGLRP